MGFTLSDNDKKMTSENINYSILNIKEKERQRIAKDLHDISMQNLSYLVHRVELTSLYIDSDPVKAKLELAAVGQKMRQIIDEMRKIVFNLHPISLDDLGLKVTIERMIDIVNPECKFFIEKDIDDVSCEDELIMISILRLSTECCRNAVKHSNGNKIWISLKLKNNKFILKVKDNGCGFDINEVGCQGNHFGIYFMQERVYLVNGKMKIDSSENGTSIKIEIPIPE